MTQHAAPWTSKPTTRLSGLVKTPRALDVLDVCYGEACVRRESVVPAVVTKGLWANPSQNLNHGAKAVYGTPGTFTKSTVWYSFEHDATLTASAQLETLGWHRGAAGGVSLFSESDMRSLSGEAFSVADRRLPRLHFL